MENRHIPVLLNEVIDSLAPAAAGTVVDCTLGGGGHTEALLRRYPDVKILACDVDERAIENARARLSEFVGAGRLAFYHGNFSELADEASAAKIPPGFAPLWSGVLADLGYSSNQLEDPRYGMSFMVDAPLDMRLSRPPRGESAWELLLESDEENLAEIFRAYGEMSGAGRLARRIKEAIATDRLHDSTLELANLIEKAQGGRGRSKIHPATQVFQALRIAVNDELRVLDHFLEGVILKLSPAGRLAIITFHSLEDRIVKRFGQKHGSTLTTVTRKPVVADESETAANPRARSAKLRVYERT